MGTEGTQSLVVRAGQLACLTGHAHFRLWLSAADSDLQGRPLPASDQAPVSQGARLFFRHLAVEGCSGTSWHQWPRARFDLQHRLLSDTAASLGGRSSSLPAALAVFPRRPAESRHIPPRARVCYPDKPSSLLPVPDHRRHFGVFPLLRLLSRAQSQKQAKASSATLNSSSLTGWS